MRLKPLHFILMFILFIIGIELNAQVEVDSTNLFQIETTDGNQYIGNITYRDSLRVEFISDKLGKLNFLMSDVKRIIKIAPEKLIDGKLWFDNPQASRYFFSPNGYGLKRGEGYYQNIWVLWNQASFGITDNISLGVGIIPLFLFGAGESTPIWVVPKVSIPVVKDKFNLGVGVLAGTIGFQENSGFGIAYGLGTLGSHDKNITVGFGYGYAGGDWLTSMITISGMARVSPRGYLVTENYIILADETSIVLISAGGRSFIKNITIDYGLIVPLVEDAGFIALPWLGIAIPIQSKKKDK